MNLVELWNQYGAAHPIASHLLVLAVGLGGGNKLVSWLESKVPGITDWLDDRQVSTLKKLGLSDEQIRAVRKHEVADMRKAADEEERRIASEEAAAAHLAAPAPAADAPKP